MSSKIIFVGDVHIGNHKKHGGSTEAGINTRCQLILDVLEKAVDVAFEEDADALVILGDLFENPRPTPQMLTKVQDILARTNSIVIAGNHDQCSDHPDDHALGPLAGIADVISEKEIISLPDVDLLLVPYQSGECSEWLSKHVDELMQQSTNERRVLAFHSGIKDNATDKWLIDSRASISTEKLWSICNDRIDAVFAGHWHNNRYWIEQNKTPLYQVGALVPTGWNNEGLDYGWLYTLDATQDGPSISRQRVEGPRFLTVTADDDLSVLKNLTKTFLRIKAKPHQLTSAVEVLEATKKIGKILDGSVVLEDQSAKDTARKAAARTQSAKTLTEAISTYVASIPLDDFDGDERDNARKDIFDKISDYLNMANK